MRRRPLQSRRGDNRVVMHRVPPREGIRPYTKRIAEIDFRQVAETLSNAEDSAHHGRNSYDLVGAGAFAAFYFAVVFQQP